MVIEEPRPKKRPTIITYIIIVACFIFFLITLGKDGTMFNESNIVSQAMMFVPDQFVNGQNLHTLVTAAFLHGDWIHIISNMYFLWVFGDDTEDIMGRFTFVIFFLFAAALGSFFYALVTISLNPSAIGIGCVGASGAIFGVMASYAIFLPNRTIVVPGYGRLTAKYYVAIYAIFETLYTFLNPILGTQDFVAHSAHVGGFLAGVFFAFAFKKLYKAKFQIAKTFTLPAGPYPKSEQAPAKIKRFFSRSKKHD